MFDFVFKCLSSVASFAFPVFASYKALQQDDITLIKPWLMYWVVIAIQLTVETYTGFILQAVPFYQMIRFGITLWLVLPQTQGASQLYVTHVQPFLSKHEREIDQFITHTHANAKAMGVEYLARLSHFIKGQVSSLLFGTEYHEYKPTKEHDDSDLTNVEQVQPTASTGTTTGASSAVTSYTDMLFSRFRYPPSGSEGYSTLQNLISGASSSIIHTLQNAHFNIPSSITSRSEMTELRSKLMSLVTSLDERLQNMEDDQVQVQEKEQEQDSAERETTGPLTSKPSDLSLQSTSESEFDVVKADEIDGHSQTQQTEQVEPQPKKGWFW